MKFKRVPFKTNIFTTATGSWQPPRYCIKNRLFVSGFEEFFSATFHQKTHNFLVKPRCCIVATLQLVERKCHQHQKHDHRPCQHAGTENAHSYNSPMLHGKLEDAWHLEIHQGDILGKAVQYTTQRCCILSEKTLVRHTPGKDISKANILQIYTHFIIIFGNSSKGMSIWYVLKTKCPET